MTVQTVPYALQNASHSAALFRQSASAPFLTGGALGSGELLVSQQGSPNMSVLLGPGRAKVAGTAVSPPAGQSWTTQAMYDVLNDAALTLTIAASNPTNPRIDVAYVQVQDSFYSGATNQAIAGVVTGTPAPSPSVPAVPANATAIATIAVGAGVTSIVNANVARVVSTVATVGGLYPTATPTTLAALQTAATLPNPSRVTVLANGSEWYWGGTSMRLDNMPRVASAAARDALYVAPVAAAAGDQVFRTDMQWVEEYHTTATVAVAGWFPIGGALPYLWLGMTAAQNSANGGNNAPVLWDLERKDLLNWHSTVTNTSRITVTQAGRYLVTRMLTVAGATTGQFMSSDIRVNGLVIPGTLLTLPATNALLNPFSGGAAYVDLANGDYVEIGGSSATTVGYTQSGCSFQLEYVGPA